VSWPSMLKRQDISPFGSCLTSGLQWRLVTRDFFGARMSPYRLVAEMLARGQH
jgi:hypothetical protein